MRIAKLSDMTGGWFIGNFIPTAFKTNEFEVKYCVHKKGERHTVHYHKEATEINLLIRGKMSILGHVLNSGDIFIIYPEELSDPVFIEDCKIVCVKIPSLPGDKYELNR